MSIHLANKPQRRFLKLRVGEISIVDSPANEVEFNVVKRLDQEGIEMDAETTETTGGETAVDKNAAGDSAEAVAVEAQIEATGEAVSKSLGIVADLVKSITGAADAPETETAKADGAETTGDDVKKRGFDRSKFSKILEGAGLKGDGLKKALDAAEKQLHPFPDPDAKPPLKKGAAATKKSADGAEAAPDAEAVQAALIEKTLEGVLETINKAKQFTPTRAAQLQKALEILNDLMKQLSMQKIPTGGSPSTTVPASTQFGASGITSLTKQLESIATSLAEVANVNKSLSDRMTVIEGAPEPSQSVEDDGGTDTKTQKGGDVWSGSAVSGLGGM